MNPITGSIASFESDADALEAGYTVLLTPTQAKTLTSMNRRQRREWARKHGQPASSPGHVVQVRHNDDTGKSWFVVVEPGGREIAGCYSRTDADRIVDALNAR